MDRHPSNPNVPALRPEQIGRRLSSLSDPTLVTDEEAFLLDLLAGTATALGEPQSAAPGEVRQGSPLLRGQWPASSAAAPDPTNREGASELSSAGAEPLELTLSGPLPRQTLSVLERVLGLLPSPEPRLPGMLADLRARLRLDQEPERPQPPLALRVDDDPIEPPLAVSDSLAEPLRASQSSPVQSISTDTLLSDSDQAVDALLIGSRWGTGGPTTPLTYSFPSSANQYESNYYDKNALASISELNPAQKAAARKAFQSYANISGLVFSEESVSPGIVSNADLRLARSNYPGTAYCYYPNTDPVGGDSFFNSSKGYYDSPTPGNYAYHTFLHEQGHGLGLKHGHETSGPGAMPSAQDSMEYSVMTYRAYVGANTSLGYTNETWGYCQTLMMMDIAAIQRLYGANYSTNAGDTTYSFSPTSGSFLINGNSIETPGANRIFRTIWDGAGQDTYDFSNYATKLSIDLAPGSYCDLDVGGSAQRAVLQSYSTGYYQLSNGSTVYLEYTTARGHVFNSLLYNGNVSSLIENANGGSSDDVLRGNQANNSFAGNGGNDVFLDSLGSDRYFGGSGTDAVYFDKAFNQYIFNYNASSSLLSVSQTGTSDSDQVSKDIETLYFNNVAYAFSALADVVGPTLVSSTPADNATAVGRGNALVLTFSEAVRAGSGTIVLSASGDTRSIQVTDSSQVSFSGSTLTINPLLDLNPSTSYSLQVAAGAVLDSAGNSFAGISDSTTLNFTTAAPPLLSISASNAVQAEGNSGSTLFSFSVSRSGDLSGSSSATWTVTGSGTSPADASDFGGSLPSGNVSFGPDESTRQISVLISGDNSQEANEGFSVTLSAPSNASLSVPVAAGTINNDDLTVLPQLSLNAVNAVQAEGNSGTTLFSFSVTRSGDLSVASSASWSIIGSGNSAADADDFGSSLPSGSVAFAAGETTQSISVLVTGDRNEEANEEFTISLSSPTGATLAVAAAQATINNDDVTPPVVTQITNSSNDGHLAIGETVDFVVTFSTEVLVSGTPVLRLANGGQASYLSGSGSSSLRFAYTVAPSDGGTADLSTASSNAISLSGATISSRFGTAADVSAADGINPSGTLKVDVTPPVASATAVDGNTVIVSFSEPLSGSSLVAGFFQRQIDSAAATAATGLSFDPLSNRLILTFSGTAPLSTSSVRLSYTPSGSSGQLSDAAGNPLQPFSNRVVETYQSATTVSSLGNGGTVTPATSFVNLVLTGSSAINGSGNGLANTIQGNGAFNVLDGRGGIDLIDGQGAGDVYIVYTSGDHAAAEFRDSGSSGIDEVRFASATAGQTLTLAAGDTGLETAVIGTGLTTAANTAGTTALNLDAQAVLNGLTITGNAGANLLTGTAFADRINGNSGIDTLTGSSGSDTLSGGAGLDRLSGGGDGDTFVYTTLSDGLVGGTSTARSFEWIRDLVVGQDRFDAPGTTVRTVKQLGSVSALSDTAIGNLLNASSGGTVNFLANGASSFSFGTRRFLAINNGTTGYSATTDAIVEITDVTNINGSSNLNGLSIS